MAIHKRLKTGNPGLSLNLKSLNKPQYCSLMGNQFGKSCGRLGLLNKPPIGIGVVPISATYRVTADSL